MMSNFNSWIHSIIFSLLYSFIFERSFSQPIPIVTPIELTMDDIQEIVRAHNFYRSIVEPAASNMQRIEWNTELAMVAQAYAETCTFEENPNRAQQAPSFATVGENRAFGRSRNYTNLIERGWFAQRINFDYNANMCFTQGVCDQYLQLVWAESNLVGCGVAICSAVRELPILPNAVVLVCNYAPEGNIQGVRPYESGQPCSNCPLDMPVCVNNVCSSRENTIITTTTEEVPMTTARPEAPPTTVAVKPPRRPNKSDEDEDSRDFNSRESSESDSK